MKLTEQQLKQIIQEELEDVLMEAWVDEKDDTGKWIMKPAWFWEDFEHSFDNLDLRGLIVLSGAPLFIISWWVWGAIQKINQGYKFIDAVFASLREQIAKSNPEQVEGLEKLEQELKMRAEADREVEEFESTFIAEPEEKYARHPKFQQWKKQRTRI